MDTGQCLVVVLTFNCQSIIGETLAQAKRVCLRPLVVDSFSTDRTVEIVQDAGCELQQRPFSNYGDQRNWAIAQARGRAAWQLHLDADEVLDDEAVRDILRVVGAGPSAHDALPDPPGRLLHGPPSAA